MLTFMNDCTGGRLQPANVVSDFEVSLIDSVMTQFPDARVIGCLFHFKQAIRRRMLKLRIRQQEVTIAMEIGVLDMLTVVNPAHVDPLGINYVTSLIMSRCNTAGVTYSTLAWEQFWRYFRRTWLTIFPVDVWNVYGMDLRVVSRTNNPLERFNRELNAAIGAPHPSVAAFVSTIEQISRRYVQLLADISTRRAVPPAYGDVVLPNPAELVAPPVAQSRQGARRTVRQSVRASSNRGGRGSRGVGHGAARSGGRGVARSGGRGPARSGVRGAAGRGSRGGRTASRDSQRAVEATQSAARANELQGSNTSRSARATRAARRTGRVTRSMATN